MRKIAAVLSLIFAMVLISGPSYGKKEKVLARVNGEPITEKDFSEALEVLPPQLRAVVQSNPDMKKKFLENLINQKLLLQQMRKEGVKEDEEIKRKVRQYREALLLKKYVDEKLSNIKVTDEEVKEYYEKHKSEFTQPAKVKVRHILVKTKKEAEEIRKKLLKGADFAALARKYSIDKASARNGGELGELTRDSLVKEFANVAFSLKVGEISKPVKTRFGYHIIQVEKKTPEVVIPLSHVKEEIRQTLLHQKRSEALRKMIEDLKKKSKVEVYVK